MSLELAIVSKERYYIESPITITITLDHFRVGRAEHCDWIIDDPNCFVSAEHFLVERIAGLFYLTDLSSNGTFLNRQRLPHGQRSAQAINTDDEIRIGQMQINARLSDDQQTAVTPVNSEQLLRAKQQQLVQALCDEYPHLDHGAQWLSTDPMTASIPVMDVEEIFDEYLDITIPAHDARQILAALLASCRSQDYEQLQPYNAVLACRDVDELLHCEADLDTIVTNFKQALTTTKAIEL